MAGISIASITSNDAPVEKAGQAKNETEIQAEMEEIQEAITKGGSKNFLKGDFSGSADATSIKTALRNKNLINENPDDVIIAGINGWKVTGKKTGQTYKIMPNGELKRIELISVTDIYGKLYSNGTLILSSTPSVTYADYDPSVTNISVAHDYGKSTQWNSSDITKVVIYDKIAPSTCASMFSNCTNLVEIENIENLHTENSTLMNHMFMNCYALKSIDLKNFDTCNVENMQSMFYMCKTLNAIDLSMLNTSKVKNLSYIFFECSNLSKLNLNHFNTSSAETLSNMFYDCKKLEKLDLKMFNTTRVNNLSYMFAFCGNLKAIDISSFDTSNVTNMNSMFRNCNNLKTIYASDKFVTTNVSNSDKIFYSSTHIEGGKGTISGYNDDIKYAHIDGGKDDPGYFTAK